MKELGKIEGYIFESVTGAPLATRLQSNWMYRVLSYGNKIKKERMCLVTGAQRKALLDLQESVLMGTRHREDIEPRVSLEELAGEINQSTRNL